MWILDWSAFFARETKTCIIKAISDLIVKKKLTWNFYKQNKSHKTAMNKDL